MVWIYKHIRVSRMSKHPICSSTRKHQRQGGWAISGRGIDKARRSGGDKGVPIREGDIEEPYLVLISGGCQ